ncbi:MAG: hypothetical protein Q8S44_04335, partial [Flavobacteriaceae bacterium]|nr:hypothetical protein [Flavobacteriaceae bacterium]
MNKFKAKSLQTNNSTRFILAALILISISSCNSVKYVPKDKFLLKKNKITVNDKKSVDENLTDYIVQRPNQLVLGVPLPLYLYNLGNKSNDTAYAYWLNKNPKTHQFLSKVFSEKQVVRIGNSYKGLHNWFLKSGEEPVILDSLKSQITAEKLRLHYINEGYFKNDVSINYSFKKNQKANVVYNVAKNKPFLIDSVFVDIQSQVLDSMYQTEKQNSFLKSNERFRDQNFREESKRLTKQFRNSGIYHFSENSIGFYQLDSTNTNYKTNVLLQIDNQIIEKNDSIYARTYVPYKINKVSIFTDYSFLNKEKQYQDSLNYKGIQIYAVDKINFSPKFLANSIFIESSNLYSDINRDLTRNYLRTTQNFRLVDVKYTENDNNTLDAAIYLSPLKRYNLDLITEITHSNIRLLGISHKISLLNRNTFKGAEIFRLSLQGSFLNTSRDASNNSNFFNAWEAGIDASIKIPKFLLPFKTSSIIPKHMYPKTEITVGTSWQKNIGLDIQKFTGIIDYSWETTPQKKHSLELLDAQYIRNLNVSSYFDIYASEFLKLSAIAQNNFNQTITTTSAIPFYNNNIDETFQNSNPEEYQIARNIKKRYDIITENILIPLIAYSYTYNNSESYNDHDFSYFKIRIAGAGNFTNLFTTQKEGATSKELLGIPIAQYFRTDIEYKKFWDLTSENILAFRTRLGIAIPYGNSSQIPFSRNYFA